MATTITIHMLLRLHVSCRFLSQSSSFQVTSRPVNHSGGEKANWYGVLRWTKGRWKVGPTICGNQTREISLPTPSILMHVFPDQLQTGRPSWQLYTRI